MVVEWLYPALLFLGSVILVSSKVHGTNMYLVQDDWIGRVPCIVLAEMSPVFLTELLCDWDLSRYSAQTYGFCHLLCMKHQERTSEEAYRWDSSRSRHAKKVHFKPWATQLDVQQLILKPSTHESNNVQEIEIPSLPVVKILHRLAFTTLLDVSCILLHGDLLIWSQLKLSSERYHPALHILQPWEGGTPTWTSGLFANSVWLHLCSHRCCWIWILVLSVTCLLFFQNWHLTATVADPGEQIVSHPRGMP